MALMAGTGPFGRTPAGVFNFEVDAPERQLYLERSPRRIRAVIGGEVVADSTDAHLLHETGLLPVYYLPRQDVREELLERSDTSTHCPFKGDASYWHVRVGDELREDAIWAYPEPIEGAPPLADLVAFDWDAVDEWYEEAERIGVHPRDPYHRCDVIRSDRHVVVRVDGEVVAESDRARLLFETGLPPRTYLPAEDVDGSRLEPSDTVTRCPYKGTTSRYHAIRVGDRLVEDAVWVYDEPNEAVRDITGLLAFYDDKVEIESVPTRWQLPDPTSTSPKGEHHMTDRIHAERREPATPTGTLDLDAAGRDLLEQAGEVAAGRAARTLTPGAGALLKQTLVALEEERHLDEHTAPGPATLQVLSGAVTLREGEHSLAVPEHGWTVLPTGAHALRADRPAVVLITVALPQRSE